MGGRGEETEKEFAQEQCSQCSADAFSKLYQRGITIRYGTPCSCLGMLMCGDMPVKSFFLTYSYGVEAGYDDQLC